MKNSLLVIGISTAMGALMAPSAAQAAQATSPAVTINLPINAPTCTVANTSGNSITLTSAPLSQTLGSYQAANWPTAGLATSTQSGNYFTSSTLNQTATISCSTANAQISSVVVQPGSNATLLGAGSAVQYLVDTTTPTPLKAGGGALAVAAEQVSINGTATPWNYTDIPTGQPKSYSTPFFTGSLSTGGTPVSTATVVWRPQFTLLANNTSALLGNPTGGTFSGSFLVLINY